MKSATKLERAAATRRAVSAVCRTAFRKSRRGGEGARSGVLPASDMRGDGRRVGASWWRGAESGPEADTRPLPYYVSIVNRHSLPTHAYALTQVYLGGLDNNR